MKYRNASDILPDELLKELQKYASGETLYIPSNIERKKWGMILGQECFTNSEMKKFAIDFLIKKALKNLLRNTVFPRKQSGR